MQHSNNGAVLGATGGAGRGRRVPGPSPALFLSYTNSPASAPSAQLKGPAATPTSFLIEVRVGSHL